MKENNNPWTCCVMYLIWSNLRYKFDHQIMMSDYQLSWPRTFEKFLIYAVSCGLMLSRGLNLWTVNPSTTKADSRLSQSHQLCGDHVGRGAHLKGMASNWSVTRLSEGECQQGKGSHLCGGTGRFRLGGSQQKLSCRFTEELLRNCIQMANWYAELGWVYLQRVSVSARGDTISWENGVIPIGRYTKAKLPLYWVVMC